MTINRLEMIKRGIIYLTAYLILQMIFFTMNDTVAFIIMMVGLTTIGYGYYKLIMYMRKKIGEVINEINKKRNGD